MNSFRKFTAALAALAVTMTSVFTFSVAVAATTFTDASGIASWASASVTALADSGVLSGRPDGSFDPQGQLNRAEVAKVATLAAGLTEDTTGAPHFNDVAASDWFYSYVETLYNNGVVGGINGGALDSNGLATYNPGGTLNRAEGSKILVDAFDLETSYSGTPPNFPDVASSAWFYDYVETAYAHGIVNGYSSGDFGPGDAITREQIAVIAKSGVDEAADASKRRTDYTAGAASSVEPTTPTTPTTPTSDGDLTVAVSASTPPAVTFPAGTASTAVAAYDFTAASDDVVISNVVITRTGVGTDSDWTLYLYDDNERLTSGKTVNSTTHAATFTGVNVTVAAGTTKTLTLKADTATSPTGGDNFFEISSADDVTTNAQSVGGSFPVKSNKQEINANISAGTITITPTGSISNPKVGEDNAAIAKFKLATANEAGLVKEIALLVGGTVSASEIQNAKLSQGGTELATTASVNSKDLLVFTFDTPFEILKGDSRNFELRADLNTGRGADTIQIYIDENTDIVATGGTYGFGMSVTATAYDTTGESSSSTIQGGEITISSSGPAATDIAVNGDDIIMMEFNVTSISEITVKKFSMLLTTNDADSAADQGGLLGGTAGTTANYTDIKIINKDTGSTVMGPIDSNVLTATAEGTTIAATTDGDGYYVFTDEFTMAAGESLDLQLVLDLANNSEADFTDDTIYATIDIVDGSYPELKDINNKTIDVGDNVVPTSDITGKTMTVNSPSLTVTKSSTPVSDTAVKGTEDVDLIGFTMAAGDASDVKITEMVIRVRADTDTTFLGGQVAASDIVNNIELWAGDVKIAGPEGLSLTGTLATTGYYYATFDNMDYTVSAGSTIQVVAKGDLSSSTSATRYIGADIDPDNDITAEDVDGNTVTAGGTTALNAAATQVPVLTVSTGGSLTIAVDADTTKENIVVAGTSDTEISKFKFTTTDEAFIVKKLSINNRQSAVTDATTLGDYDNNVVSVKLSYTNSDGATETKTGFLTNGTADFSGMDMFIDKDDDAVLTVSATLNTVAAGATAGEFVDLNLALNDFDSIAQGSGETYTAAKTDSAVAAASDLDFGTITWTTSTYQGNNTGATLAVGAPGSSVAMIMDTGSMILPVGTLILADVGDTGVWTDGADSVFVLTAAMTTTTMTLTVLDDDDASVADNVVLWYALPGTGYLTQSNQMVIYESKPTIALSSSSPSGSRTVAASDNAFIFTISADAQEKIQFQAAQVNDCTAATTDFQASALDGTFTAGVGALSAPTTGGIGNSAYARNTATGADGTIIYTFAAAADLSAYEGISFWARNSAAEALVMTLDDDAGTDPNTTVTPTAATWTFVDYPFTAAVKGTANANVDVIATMTLSAAGSANTDTIDLDRVVLYTEKITVNIASDADIDTNTAGSADNLVAYLKDGGSTVATGYVYSATQAADASAAAITFYPQSGTDSTIEISKGTSKTFTLQLNTGSLLAEDAGSDDPVTFSINLGSSAAGTVTNGDIWWNETNANVKWLGQVDDTTLNGNTLKY
jgi:hypothetical protein